MNDYNISYTIGIIFMILLWILIFNMPKWSSTKWAEPIVTYLMFVTSIGTFELFKKITMFLLKD